MTESRVIERARRGRRGGGSMVRRAENAVHSVRNRVMVFRNGGVRRRRMHREFIALRYRVVYVGAIAVLLRFVVMRLNVNEWKEEQREEEERSRLERGKMGVRGVGRVYGLERRKGWRQGAGAREGELPAEASEPWREKMERHRRRDERERMNSLGQYRYTEGRKYVWLAGLVRRVSRRGAVSLTREEGGMKRTKRQRVNEQLSRGNGKGVLSKYE